MKSRWWFAPLILALLLFVGQAHADSIVNVAYNFETVISYECAHGNCEWVTRVHPLPDA